MKRTIPSIFALLITLATVSCGSDILGMPVHLNLKQIELGREDDFKKIGPVILANPKAWGLRGTEGHKQYREMLPNADADIFFAAFDVDENGFCKHDMILEILYRDDIRADFVSKYRAKGIITVQSRIDFAESDEYVEVGRLETKGDNEWKWAQIFLEHSPFQRARAIDGSFKFRIATSRSPKGSLPVSKIRFLSVGHDTLVSLREEDRKRRGLERIDYEPAEINSENKSIKTSEDFVVYPVNYLELIFPNSDLSKRETSNQLQLFEIPGQAEPISFVIAARKDLTSVAIDVGSLKSNDKVIPVENIDVRSVILNDQRWGWSWTAKYGLCPDYLSLPNPVVDIKAGTNSQFWLTINIPDNAEAGAYSGDVLIRTKESQPYRMVLKIEVLPIKLRKNLIKHMVYHSPFFKNFHSDPIVVFEDMKEHGVVPVFYSRGRVFETARGLDIDLSSLEYELQVFRQVFHGADEIFIGLFDYAEVWRRLKGPEPKYERHFPEFEDAYGEVLSKYAGLCRRYGLEPAFSFTDEPGTVLGKRRVSYLCSSIACKNGLKTWSSHYASSDTQLELTEEEKIENVNYLRPLAEVLSYFVSSIRRVNEPAIEHIKSYNSGVSYYTTYLATSVRPMYNRFLHGFYPFRVGATHIVSYAYRDMVNDPFDDLDLSSGMANLKGMNDYLLTYPTWEGEILPTLSYEALREGVEDSYLISTLMILAQEAKNSSENSVVTLGQEAEDYIGDVFSRMKLDFWNEYYIKHKDVPVDPLEKILLNDLSGNESGGYGIFNKIRKDVCDRIIILQNAVL
ncbi:MAG: hypothetical protein ACYSSP_07485 [Planctomycetota bacterium]|jgi:hypothetical protein